MLCVNMEAHVCVKSAQLFSGNIGLGHTKVLVRVQDLTVEVVQFDGGVAIHHVEDTPRHVFQNQGCAPTAQSAHPQHDRVRWVYDERIIQWVSRGVPGDQANIDHVRHARLRVGLDLEVFERIERRRVREADASKQRQSVRRGRQGNRQTP